MLKKTVAVLFFTLRTTLAMAQLGAIMGRAIDVDNNSIAKVKITITDTTGLPVAKATTVTDFAGDYYIYPLQPGKYHIVATSKAYAADTIKGIIVKADNSTFVNMRLRPKGTIIR
jgi:hypothetical protein